LKVSVVLPVHNGQQYLAEVIESVLQQTVSDVEVVVVDDGSTDNSPAILKKYGNRITVRSQENRGVAASRNKGVEVASGELIAFIDQDDLWYPDKLEKQVRVLRDSETDALVYCDFDLIDRHGHVTRRCALAQMKADHMRAFIGGQLHPYPSTMLMKKSLFVQVGGFDAGFRENKEEDIDFVVRVHATNPLLFIREALVQYRIDTKYKTSKRRSAEVMAENFMRLHRKLDERFGNDPEKREPLDRILAMAMVNRGKALASAGDFKAARAHFREASNLSRSWRHKWRYLRTLLPLPLRRLAFPREP
jgi:glycosyltransferase involved in cell wall biosynthesis